MLDLLSDIYVIVDYNKEEETAGYGKTLTAMVVSCLALEAITVVGQGEQRAF